MNKKDYGMQKKHQKIYGQERYQSTKLELIYIIDKHCQTTKDINQILDNLKSAKSNKNNMVISNEDIEKIKNFTKDVKDKEIYNLQGELSTKDKNNRKKNDTRF